MFEHFPTVNERTRAIAAQFRFAPADGEDPDVRACMERYLATWGFPSGVRSHANRWTRVNYGSEVVAVVGEGIIPGSNVVQILDLYPGVGRHGVLGVYAVVTVLKHLVDAGMIPLVSWMSAVENEAHTRALKRVLGINPIMYVWSYGNLPMPTPPESSDQAEGVPAATTPTAEPIYRDDAILSVGSAVLDRACGTVFAPLP